MAEAEAALGVGESLADGVAVLRRFPDGEAEALAVGEADKVGSGVSITVAAVGTGEVNTSELKARLLNQTI